MNNDRKEKQMQRLVSEFGINKILFALPQQEVKRVLDLVSVGELASKIRMNYG